jgi:DNA replication protein DnaC
MLTHQSSTLAARTECHPAIEPPDTSPHAVGPASKAGATVHAADATDMQLLQGLFYEHYEIGSTGTGKTHLLTAIGLAACTAGYRVLFTTAAEMCMTLIAAKRDDRLKARLSYYERFQLLLIDELGYVPFEREATDLLYQVIAQRYERASIAVTTNLAFTDWTQVFPDPMTASVVVDRLIHHSMIFEFSGESHRLRSRKDAGRPRKGA